MKTLSYAILTFSMSLLVTACAPSMDGGDSEYLPDQDLILEELPRNESSGQSDTSDSGDSDNSVGKISDPSGSTNEQSSDNIPVMISTSTVVRTLKAGVLEPLDALPVDTELLIPNSAQPVNYNYRKENGTVAFSSTGFYANIKIAKSGNLNKLSAARVSALNALSTKLFVSATVASDLVGSGDFFPPLVATNAKPDFLKYYHYSGKPKFSYSSTIRTRFPNKVNQGIQLNSLSEAQKTKWTKIMNELRRVSTRNYRTLKKLLMIDKNLAMQQAIKFEQDGTVPIWGAWSVAVLGTATRNGFANVPCAEFQSEILRQAYKRAGYSHTADFNSNKGNVLSYKGGAAAVVNFSSHLNKAGFIPWDTTQFKPPIGAFLMNGSGRSPGHTYIAAGDDGRFIVDNGSPQGRDLRGTSERSIGMMYQTGVFFLPPGFVPQPW